MEPTYALGNFRTPFEQDVMTELVRIREALERLSPVPEPEEETEPAENDNQNE